MSPDPDRMIELARIPDQDGSSDHVIYRDYDTLMIGTHARLDLDGIGRLQVALDQAVTQIREYQANQDA